MFRQLFKISFTTSSVPDDLEMCDPQYESEVDSEDEDNLEDDLEDGGVDGDEEEEPLEYRTKQNTLSAQFALLKTHPSSPFLIPNPPSSLPLAN